MLRLAQAQGRTFKVAGQRTWCWRLPPEPVGELIAAEMWEALAGVCESARRTHGWKTLPAVRIWVPVVLLLVFKDLSIYVLKQLAS